MAQSVDETVPAVSYAVERSYARYSYPLDPVSLEKSLSANASDLFPGFGFSPKAYENLTWSLTRSSDDSSLLCIKVVVPKESLWRKTLKGFAAAGLSLADATCAKTSLSSFANTYPVTVSGIKLLDRRNTLSATVLPSYPIVSGVLGPATTRPGLIVKKGATGTTIQVHNPYVEVSPGVGKVTGINSLSIRSGFSLSTTCSTLLPTQSCSITVKYLDSATSYLVSTLVVKFSTGEIASIGVSGTP